MKKLMLCAAAATLLTGATLHAVELSEKFDKTFAAKATVGVDNVNRSVTVQLWDRNEIRVEAEKTVDGSDEAAKTALKELRIDVREEGDSLRIRTIHPKNDDGFFSWLAGNHVDANVRYTVTVPRKTNLDLETVNGRIEAGIAPHRHLRSGPLDRPELTRPLRRPPLHLQEEQRDEDGEACKKTSREETCLAFGDMAKMVLRRKHCREVSRDEVLAILQRNEEDGLVLQPANTQQPEFICSCCGCCCGMLSFQRLLPRPVDFWSSSFFAEVDPSSCVHCGTCVTRCQVGAITMTGDGGEAKVNQDKCIGCGLCVPTCPSQAVRLKGKDAAAIPHA